MLQSVFDPQEAAGLVRRHRVTHCNGADVMFAGLLDAAAPGDLDSLRHGGFAAFGAVSPHDLAARADGAGLRLVGLYGMSEVQALYARRHAHAGIAERVRAGGYPVSDAARVRVRDPDADAPLPPGDAGELQLRGPSLFGEYLGNPEATAAAFTDDGWFKTGDLATADDGGGFEFLARMGDSLRLGGFLVHPGEIEAQVEHDDSVTSCQVVGVPGERGLRPVAFVIPAPGARIDEAAIVARCRSSLAGYKVPSHVFAIEAFPVTRSANGEKVQRNRLREMALEHLGGA